MTRFPRSAIHSATLASLVVLAGCSSLDPLLSNEKVDYRAQARQTTGLEVPPDLTQLQKPVPLGAGAISAADLAKGPSATPTTPAAAAASVALNRVSGAEIVRVGNQRIIRSQQTPEQLWPQIKTFWADVGFDLPKEQAAAGVLETDWKENRAKLPKDFIRKTLGTLLDSVYSTGERDRYRTRLERTASGTDIVITHQGMQEVVMGAQREQTTWTPRPSDPELEAEVQNLLLLRLGGQTVTTGTAATSTASATGANTAATKPPAALATVVGPDQLILNEDFDRAWRRVGQSLDRHGFTVEDRDRRLGLFFLRWADPSRVGKEEPNWFQRLFSKGDGPAMGRYRVAVKTEGTRSTVSVQDDKGQTLRDESAKRILGLLQQDLQ